MSIESAEDFVNRSQLQYLPDFVNSLKVRDALIGALQRENDAKRLELSNDALLLACGEMSAQEMRTVKAVLKFLAEAIRKGE